MRLFVLNYGRFEVFSDRRVIGIQGFLIRAGDRNILVDTGFPPWYVSDPVGAAAADGLDFGRLVELTSDNLPAAQISRVGLAAEDITHLVVTHTHIDHIGGLTGFPNAAIVVGGCERELSQPLYLGSRAAHRLASEPSLSPRGRRCRSRAGCENPLDAGPHPRSSLSTGTTGANGRCSLDGGRDLTPGRGRA